MIKNAISQTFYVNEPTGIFLTKIDLFFSHKNDTYPVKLQIRETLNGYPSSTVVYNSDVLLAAADVNVDPETLVATTFKFQELIYLKGETEYCIVAYSDASEYKLWTAKMGNIDITSKTIVSEQPTLGSLFKSQNGSTWTADQSSDLSFILYKAKFDITRSGEIETFANKTSDSVLAKDSFTMTKGSNKIIVRHRRHGFMTGDKVKFYNVKAGSISSWYVTEHNTEFNTTPTITFESQDVGFTGEEATATAIVSDKKIIGLSFTGYGDGYDQPPLVKVNGVAVDYIKIFTNSNLVPIEIVDELNNSVSFTVNYINKSSYYVQLSAAINPTQTLDFGGTGVVTSGCQPYDILNFNCDALVPTASTNSYFVAKPVNRTTRSVAETIAITPNKDLVCNNTYVVMNEVTNKSYLPTRKSLLISSILSSTNENVSPVIDMNSMSVRLVKNVTSNFTYAINPSVNEVLLYTGTGPTFDAANDNFYWDNASASVFDQITPGKVLKIVHSSTTYYFTVKSVKVETNKRTVTFLENSTLNGAFAAGTTVTLLTHFTHDIAPTSVSNYANYVSNVISTENESTGLAIYTDANIPKNSSVVMYYRTGLLGEATKIQDKVWTEVTPTTGYITNSNTTTFNEYKYLLESLSAYNQVQVKIALKCSHEISITPPKIRNLRIIALA